MCGICRTMLTLQESFSDLIHVLLPYHTIKTKRHALGSALCLNIMIQHHCTAVCWVSWFYRKECQPKSKHFYHWSDNITVAYYLAMLSMPSVLARCTVLHPTEVFWMQINMAKQQVTPFLYHEVSECFLKMVLPFPEHSSWLNISTVTIFTQRNALNIWDWLLQFRKQRKKRQASSWGRKM